MQNIIYRLKTKTVMSFLIIFLFATVLLQGTLAIYNNNINKTNSLRMASLIISNDVEHLLSLFSSIDSFTGMLENKEFYNAVSTADNEIFLDAKAFNALNDKFKTQICNSSVSMSLNNLIFFISDSLPVAYIAPSFTQNLGIENYSNVIGIYSQEGVTFTDFIPNGDNHTEACIWVENIDERLFLCFSKNICLQEVQKNTIITHPLGILYISYDLASLLNQLEMAKIYPSSTISLSYNNEVIYSNNEVTTLDAKDHIEYFYSIYPGLTLTTTISKKDINSSLNLQIALEIISFVFTALFGGIMISYVSKAIVRPITNMTKHLVTNELTLLPHTKKLNPELAVLYKNHNIMVEHTQKAINDSKKSYYQMLQAQINPHFTYNALNSISAVSLMKGEFEIAQTISNLVHMMRYSIRSPEKLVRFFEELEIVNKFISIQNFRYPNKVITKYDIPEDLLDTPLPKLTLQPLVENSIFHSNINLAVSDIEITITVQKVNDVVTIIIHDHNTVDAKDINEYLKSNIPETNSNRRGLGIRNINQRLSFVFGKQYGLEYKSDETGLYAIVTVPTSE